MLGTDSLSARRMLKALAKGETNPAALATLADQNLRATPEQLCDALGACMELNPVYRRLLKMALEQLQFPEERIDQLDQERASLLSQHQDAVQRLAEVPGLGVDSAQQIIAEVGPTAATFPSEKCLSSWVGACPGEQIARSLEGNWQQGLLFVLKQQQDGYEFCQKQMAQCDWQLNHYLEQREDRSQGAPLPEEKRKGRRKKKSGNKPRFDLRTGLFRMSGTDLTRIDGIDVMTATTILSKAGWDMSKWVTEDHFVS